MQSVVPCDILAECPVLSVGVPQQHAALWDSVLAEFLGP